MKSKIKHQAGKSILTALCLASLMLTASAVQAEKVVVVPLMGTTNIGASIFWTGAWKSGYQYAIGDGMQHGGSSYICVKDHESLSSNIPPNETYWSLMAEKGDTGATGPAGPKGDTGATGPKGDQGEAGGIGPAGPKGDQGDPGTNGTDGGKGDKGDSGTSSWTDGTGTVTATVDVGIGAGAAFPEAALDVDGEVKMRATLDTCDSTRVGNIRWSGTDFQGCDGNSWLSLTYNPVSEVPTVVSGTGQVWMDRNLGAIRVATAIDDAEAYGDLYQWGRGPDGHEERTSGTTTTRSSSIDPGHGDFIIVGDYPMDWLVSPDNTLWQGVKGTHNPCPAGFRLPTAEEWQAELYYYGFTSTAMFDSPHKLPLVH